MIDFVCSERQCFNCPLPDCVRESTITIKPIRIRFDGKKIIRGNGRKVTTEVKKGNKARKPPEELKRVRKSEPLEDENGKYYLRAGKDGIPYRQSVEAHERELQRQREYYKLRKNKERTAV